MKTYKKLSILIILAFLSTNITLAQERQQDRPQGPPPVPNDEQIEKMVTDLSKELSLTEVQEEKVSDIYFDHFEKVAEQQEKNKGKRGSGHEVMQKLNSDFEADVKELLTEDQQKLYEAYLKEENAKRGKQGRPQGKKE